ncbi:MAG: hypothetical protein SGBAC_010305 [Bacillariaceae sp.]
MAPKEQTDSLKVDKNDDVSVPPPVLTKEKSLVEELGSKSTSGHNMSGSTLTSMPAPSARELKKLLRKMRDSKLALEVEEAMTVMAMLINTDENDKTAVDATVQAIVVLDGVGTVLMALKDWYMTSEPVSAVAVPLLLKLRSVGRKDSIEEIANDDCIDLCVHAMKTWENEAFVQSCCCLYLSNIASEPANKERLCEKGVGGLILAALEKYRHKKDKTVYRRAFRAMALYIAEE